MKFNIIMFEKKFNDKISNIIQDDYENGRIRWFVNNNPETTFLALVNDEVVGMCSFGIDDGESELVIYVKDDIRNNGIGTKLLEAAESKLKLEGVKKVEVSCINGEPEKIFLKKHGYKIEFSSTFMTYSGKRFEDCMFDVIPYEDQYYLECRTIIREAFHKMQVEVGIEEESFLYPPNEVQRKAYLEMADQMYMMRVDDEIVATISIDEEEIDNLAVAVEHQRKGYGKEMMAYAINKIFDEGYDTVDLWCISNNTAMEFYLKLGFVNHRTHDITYKEII